MKIMHLLPSLTSGGVEQVVLEICQGMRPLGAECVVVSAGGPMVEAIEQTGARHITRPIGKKSPATLFQIGKMAQLLREEKPDILHMHSRIPAWVGILAARKLRAEDRPVLLTTFHGYYSVNFYSAIMTKAEKIIAVSRFIKEHILECYPATQEEKICIIPNTIDPQVEYPAYRPSAEWMQQWRAEFPELQGKYILCLPSRITRLKGGEHLIPILSGLKAKGIPAHALIVGETKRGKEAFRQELTEAFARAGLSGDVTWAGLRRDMRDVFCASDVVLSLTLKPEAFGKTTLEALALGRPVAGYAHGGVGEQLDDFHLEGKIAPGDTAGMVDLLARWYANPPASVMEVPPPYRRQDMIDAHFHLYQSLCQSHRHRE